MIMFSDISHLLWHICS